MFHASLDLPIGATLIAPLLLVWWLAARARRWELKLIHSSECNINLTFHFLGVQLGNTEIDFFPLKYEASWRGGIVGLCIVIGAILCLSTNPAHLMPANECAGATLGLGRGWGLAPMKLRCWPCLAGPHLQLLCSCLVLGCVSSRVEGWLPWPHFVAAVMLDLVPWVLGLVLREGLALAVAPRLARELQVSASLATWLADSVLLCSWWDVLIFSAHCSWADGTWE